MLARYLTLSFVVLSIVLTACIAVGCSGMNNDSITPPTVGEKAAVQDEDSQRVLWGMWTLGFNTETLEVDATPLRKTQAHFNITNMIIPPACDDCLDIVLNAFSPTTRILDVDITLTNPYPINGRDVRGILFTNAAGHELRNPDAWTKLWDPPGGGTINPFKAFAKTEANRIFGGLAEHTENYQVYIPIPPAYWAITFAVDASWPGNCKEPYAIDNFTQVDFLYEDATYSAVMEVDVADWQDDVNKVTLVAPDITGQGFSAFTHVTGNLWRIEVTNNENAAAGYYDVRVIADSTDSTEPLYDFVTITISTFSGPLNPVDVTPPWLNIGPLKVVVDGNYAYTVGGPKGLHIFDISDPTDPTWLSRVDIPGHQAGAIDVVISGAYAFVAGEQGLHIVNILDKESPYIAKTVPLASAAISLTVDGNYAYVCAENEVKFIDISSISGASAGWFGICCLRQHRSSDN